MVATTKGASAQRHRRGSEIPCKSKNEQKGGRRITIQRLDSLTAVLCQSSLASAHIGFADNETGS